MYMTKVTVSDKDVALFAGDLLVFAARRAEDGSVLLDARLEDLLRPQIDCKDFTGRKNEVTLLYPASLAAPAGDRFLARRIVVVGLGENTATEDGDEVRETLRSAGGTVSRVCEKLKAREVMVSLDTVELAVTAEVAVECFAEGLLLGDYRFGKYKKDDPEKPRFPGLTRVSFSAAAKSKSLRRVVRRAAVSARAVHSARDMANEPGNGWTAAHFASYAEKLAKKYQMKCTILDRARMKELGMGGILAVNQGSADPPKLVIVEYRPEQYEQTVMLVGKGLTFDSGGISLKPAEGMMDMKYDMCGGAAVLAAMQAIGEERPAVRVVALVPATDNMTGSSALKPGDIIRHYNGVTSEVVSTDAEGRLILADSIAYGIKEYGPACVVDVATLTGAAVIGLGHHNTGILGNDDEVVEQLIAAGRKCGEPLWRLPLGKAYSKQIESKVADIKNTGGRPGGTCTAAAFIEHFVADTPWAHLDIAGTAWNFTEKTYIPEGPSGIMVRTLVEFVRSRNAGF